MHERKLPNKVTLVLYISRHEMTASLSLVVVVDVFTNNYLIEQQRRIIILELTCQRFSVQLINTWPARLGVGTRPQKMWSTSKVVVLCVPSTCSGEHHHACFKVGVHVGGKSVPP